MASMQNKKPVRGRSKEEKNRPQGMWLVDSIDEKKNPHVNQF